jgi:hypothetical protein
MKVKWFLLTGVFAVLIISLWFLLRLNKMDNRKAEAIASWLRSTKLKPGINTNVKLPAQFSGLAASSSVEVMLQQNGKLAYFLKSTKGFKGNYRGYIYVDSGFLFTISKDYYGRSTTDIFASGGDSAVINKKLSNNLYAVFFDLN